MKHAMPVFAALLFAAVAPAHTLDKFQLNMAPSSSQTFRIINSAQEKGCTTTVQPARVLSERLGLVTVTPPGLVVYTADFSEYKVESGPTGGGANIVLDWSAMGGTCNQSGVLQVLVIVSVEFIRTNGSGSNAGVFGDPVSTATGEHFGNDDVPDLFLGGPLPLELRRYYASYLKSNNVASALGDNWMHTFDVKLTVSGVDATVTLFQGTQVRFTQAAAGWQLAAGERRNYQLTSDAGGFRFLDPLRNWIYSFSSSGALTRLEDRNGNALSVAQAASGSGPEQVSDGLGRTLTFRYQGSHLVEVADPSGRKVQFQQTGDNLVQVIDPQGKIHRYSYAAAPPPGLLTEEILPAGNKPVMTVYDNLGRAARQTDSRGNTATLEYDRPSAGITTVTDPLSNISRHTHESQRDLTLHTDAAGQSTRIAYDANHRPITVTDRRGNRAASTYDAAGNLTSFTDTGGNTARFTWSPQNRGGFTFYNLTAVDLPDGAGFRLLYDGAGNLTTLTDQAGKTWTYTYNSRGQLLTARNPAGGTTTHLYNPDATRASTTLPAGDSIRFEYDPLKRPARLLWPDGTSQRFTYGARDELLTAVDERNKTAAFAYDDNGRLARLTDPLGAAASLAYDGDDRLSALTDRLGKVTRWSYDAVGRPQRATNPAGEIMVVARDPVGRVTTVSDAAGNLATFARDPEGALSAVTDALANRWTLARDARGLVTQITEPTGATYRSSYDALGRPASVTNPLGQRTEISYEPRGLPSRISLPGGIAASYAYTDLGELGRIADPNGGSWTRGSDAQGRLVSETDPLNRATSYAYDNRQRLRRVGFPQGSLELSHDAAGNLLRESYSDSTDLRYTYDDNNRLVSATGLALGYDAERITNSNGLLIGRDDAGRVASITYAPGKTVAYAYNNRGRVSRVTDWTGATTELSYDANRRLISIRRPNGVTTQYTYDASGRVARITDSGGAASAFIALTRDAWGRVTSAERNLPRVADPEAGAEQFAWDAAHQEAGTAAYDSLGRPTAAGGNSFTWDLASRLTRLATPQGSHSFSYDALGLMVSGRRNYVWNYALDLPSIAVFRTVQADLRYFVHLPDGSLLYSLDAADNQRRFYHFDEMGNTVFLTGDSGAVTDAYGITPYGEVVSRSGSTENPFTFQGRWGVLEIEDTSLYYMRARFYDAAAGRFLSRDPVRTLDPRSANPYPYALGNPLRYVDPTGLKGELGDWLGYIRETRDRRGIGKGLGWLTRKWLLRRVLPRPSGRWSWRLYSDGRIDDPLDPGLFGPLDTRPTPEIEELEIQGEPPVQRASPGPGPSAPPAGPPDQGPGQGVSFAPHTLPLSFQYTLPMTRPSPPEVTPNLSYFADFFLQAFYGIRLGTAISRLGASSIDPPPLQLDTGPGTGTGCVLQFANTQFVRC